ncbi:MAG: Ppx/GppA family phosphatase [Chthonomonadales bacterium]
MGDPGEMAAPGVYAAIDVGTNTVKLTIAERRGSGSWTELMEQARTTRLGEGFSQGYLQAAAIRRTIRVLAEYAELCRRAAAQSVAAVATAAVRHARNQDEFVHQAAEAGISVEILSEGEEARLSFLAVRKDPLWHSLNMLRVVDIGGGSTEIVLGTTGGIRSATVPVGAVQITEDILRTDPPTTAQIHEAEQFVFEALRHAHLAGGRCPLVGVGGTVAHMAAVQQGRPLERADQIHGCTLAARQVEEQLTLYAAKPIAARSQIPGLDAARAAVILGGAIILRIVMERFGNDTVQVSGRGLRWGLLYDRFDGSANEAIR